MTPQTEYLVKYRYINTGTDAHEVFKTNPDEKRPILKVIEEAWKGLLCQSGGLRNIVTIKEIKNENSNLKDN